MTTLEEHLHTEVSRCVFALLNLQMTSPLANLELVKSHHSKALKSANNNS